MIRHLDLFSGIGGFALALDNVYGKENIEHIFCDNDEFCQEVLKKHWPQSKIYGDIRTLTANAESRRCKQQNEAVQAGRTAPFTCDFLTGGFPCQPFSQAGRRKGTADDRYLWPEMFRVIQLTQPQWVIAENVRGLLTWNDGMVLEQVCADLESEGYEVQPLIIPAVAVNAPHRRDRIWFVANSKVERLQRFRKQSKRTKKTFPERTCNSWERPWLEVATELCRVDDGLPRRMDRNPRLKALGNAIVPQVAEEIIRAIYETSNT